MPVSGNFLFLPIDMQLGNFTLDRYDKCRKNDKFIFKFFKSVATVSKVCCRCWMRMQGTETQQTDRNYYCGHDF